MEDFLPRREHASRGSEGLPGTRIAGVPEMRAARDDETQTVPTMESMGGRPALDRYPPNAVGVGRGLAGSHPQIAIEDLKRLARRLHVAEAGIEIGMCAVGPEVEVDSGRPNDIEIRGKRSGGERDSVGPCLQQRHVSCLRAAHDLRSVQ